MSSLHAAIECYIDLLASRHFESSESALARATREQNLVWLDRPLCSVLRPCFVAEPTLRRARRAVALVARGLNTISGELLRDPELRRNIDLTDVAEATVRTDPGRVREIVGRLDGFISPEGVLKFIEYNPDPGAVANYYRLSRLFGALPIMREFARRYHARNTSSWTSLAWVLARMAGRLLVGGGLTVIWSGAPPEDPLSRQLELEIEAARRAARALALRMNVVRPEALSFGRDQAFHGRRRVAFAYVTDWEGLLRAFPFGHPFWRATAAGNLSVLNSWASRVVRGNKGVFVLLSDPQYRRLYGSEVADALASHIPWTRRVREGWTTWRDERIDLLPFIARRRPELVLKPAALQGGKGVVLGWLSSDAEWSAALDRALASPHVIQERAAERRERYPSVTDGRLDVREYATDFNAFVWSATTPHGYMARVSEGALMNVTAGSGTLTPVFSVRARG